MAELGTEPGSPNPYACAPSTTRPVFLNQWVMTPEGWGTKGNQEGCEAMKFYLQLFIVLKQSKKLKII